MSIATVHSPDPRQVLAKAVLRAGKELGLSQAELGQIIGRDRSSIGRGVDPASKAGELAALFVRAYRALYVLTGGSPEDLRHWVHTANRHTGGVPAEQMKTVQGLMRVVEYLDAIRGKT